MPIFNSDISAENFLNTIRIGQFPSDALKTYGFGNPGALANVRYRASIYEWGLKRSLNLPGDLVDFGAYHGLFPFLFHSSHDIALFGKQHHLFDAWGGGEWNDFIDNSTIQADDGRTANSRYRNDIYAQVEQIFKPHRAVKLHRGLLPKSASELISSSRSLAFCCIDVNSTGELEKDLLELVWDRLAPGAMLYIDDYGFAGYPKISQYFQGFSRLIDSPLFEVPTGSAFLLK